jgi:hypothetical protein
MMIPQMQIAPKRIAAVMASPIADLPEKVKFGGRFPLIA